MLAIPRDECEELLTNQEQLGLTKDPGSLHSSDEVFHQSNSPNPITMPTIGTPEAQKKKVFSGSDSKDTFEKTPESTVKSPSSVLNPPSSLKRRTIRDYFVAA